MDVDCPASEQAELTALRIGLNAVFLQPRMGGLETFVRRLVPALVQLRPEAKVSVFANADGARSLRDEWGGEVEVVTHPLLGRRYLRAFSELALLGALADRRRLDLLHSVAMVGPLRLKAAHVVTVGDLIWWHDPASTGRPTAVLWRTVVPRVARRATRLQTFSEATASDIVDQLGIPRRRIDVVAPGYGTEPSVEPTPEAGLRERLGLGPGRVVLTVSAKRTHKNLLRLVRAFATVRQRAPDALLVMPGNPTAHERELASEAASLGIAGAVRLPPYVDAADLEGLYQLASCFVFPSLREGFGLPILEAMRRGVPVATARASSLPEVGGDAVRYFDPEDELGLAAAVVELLEDGELASRLVAAGRKRAAQFTWEATAQATLESYDRALAEAAR
jgi:glycosyltransferase involved in cell wall biosynthesis